MIGRTLGHYRIDAPLGHGGMGVVYRATDTHLDRPVAIKVLQTDAVANPDRKRRFVQEARAASALNHPNIVHIYDIDRSDGVDFIAMEYVGGRTLADTLASGPLSHDEVRRIGLQVADALARAHGAGIIHRDLKPANVMVGEAGLVKLLDFGLAKLTEPGESAAEAETRSLLTHDGVVVGTAAYMSPEQAAGRAVDARSDIFSFGSMLYEMVTGRRPFHGDTAMSTLAAIMHVDATPPSQVTEGIPAELVQVITRCLQKDPAHRFQTMAEVRHQLTQPRADVDASVTTVAVPRQATWARRRLVIVAASAGLLIAAIASVALLREREPAASAEPAIIRPVTSFEGWESSPSWSPDGTLIAYGHNRDGHDGLFIMPVGGGDPVPLTNAGNGATTPRWSPDGRYLAFVADRGAGAGVYVMPPLGGAERRLAETGIPSLEDSATMVRILGPMPWSPDSRALLHSRRQPSGDVAVWRLDLTTSQNTQITFPPPGAVDIAASWSWDGAQIAFHRQEGGAESLWVMPASVGEPRLLVGDGTLLFSQPAWSADSRRIVFVSTRAGRPHLWEIDVASERLRQITSGATWDMYPVTARDGRLAYVPFSHTVDLYALDVETGAEERLTAHSGDNWFASFSPDGRRLVYHSNRTGNGEIWLLDLETKAEVNLTNHPAEDILPDWSPDGRELAFVSNRDGVFQVWVMDTEGGSLRRLAEQAVPALGSWMAGRGAPRWSPDGTSIGFLAAAEHGDALWVADRDGGNARPRLDGLFYFAWYPDSRHVIYVRRLEKSFTEIRVANLETGEDALLSSEPSIEPAVQPDGRAVVYTHAGTHNAMNLFLLPLEPPGAGGGLPRVAGPPRQITHGRAQWHVHQSAWSRDGRTIVYTRDADQGDIYMIENYR